MQKSSNHKLLYIILFVLTACNLLYMHYSIVIYKEVPLDFTSIFDNLTGILCDLILLYSILLIIFKGRIKPSLLIGFIIAWAWAFSNIIYSRFFFQYISLSSVGQVGNLLDTIIIECIIDSFKWKDLFFIANALFFWWGYNYVMPLKLSPRGFLKNIGIAILSVIAITIITTTIYCIIEPPLRSIGYISHHLYTHHFDLYRNSANPNWTHFQRGSIRTLLHPFINKVINPTRLSSDQKMLISNLASNQEGKTTSNVNTNAVNVIFIIVESYLSVTSDLFVNGQEITPNLNRLKRDSMVYYNGNIKSNITIGESGDGQFICMTGILPLRSEITVGRAKDVVLPGLPKVLAKRLALYTRMLIPTTPSMWEQENMCKQYGINQLSSCKDFNQNSQDLNDKQIFSYLQQLDKNSKKPFFSLVLTMSMHQPYTNSPDPSFNIRSSNLSKEYANYLNACHYTDKQIGSYIDFLKKTGLYEKSLIIITADHHPNQNSLNVKDISSDIPLYIINANYNKDSVVRGKCNQLDIYTTVLDILIKDSLKWRGLGQSLFSPVYKNSLSPKTWDVSEWILQDNYFNK